MQFYFDFQHLLFWFNEEKGVTYNWDKRAIGRCYIDMLIALNQKLTSRCLHNYFDATENILQKKDPAVLMALACHVLERIGQLQNIR